MSAWSESSLTSLQEKEMTRDVASQKRETNAIWTNQRNEVAGFSRVLDELNFHDTTQQILRERDKRKAGPNSITSFTSCHHVMYRCYHDQHTKLLSKSWSSAAVVVLCLKHC